jgi:transposase
MRIPSRDIKAFSVKDIDTLFSDPYIIHAIRASLTTVHHIKKQIDDIEKTILKIMRLRKDFKNLLTVPGVGRILGVTIMLEVGDIGRFPSVGTYASYCRCVESIRTSNGKKTGTGNRKNGNKYLSWAYIEAANAAKRSYPVINRYFAKKSAQTNKIVATKALSHKLTRASYYVMRDNVGFDEKRLFG